MVIIPKIIVTIIAIKIKTMIAIIKNNKKSNNSNSSNYDNNKSFSNDVSDRSYGWSYALNNLFLLELKALVGSYFELWIFVKIDMPLCLSYRWFGIS